VPRQLKARRRLASQMLHRALHWALHRPLTPHQNKTGRFGEPAHI
jgi:hypothetical protein